jgi:hypothetical protein
MRNKVHACSCLLLAHLISAAAVADPDLTDRSAERWRLVHELEYQDEAIRPLRLEARAAQGAYTAAAQQLLNYAESHHAIYRAEMRRTSQLSAQHKYWQDEQVELQAELRRNQLREDFDAAAQIEEELHESKRQAAMVLAEIVEHYRKNDEILSSLAQQDPRLAALLHERDRRRAAYDKAATALAEALRQQPALQQFDRQMARENAAQGRD